MTPKPSAVSTSPIVFVIIAITFSVVVLILVPDLE